MSWLPVELPVLAVVAADNQVELACEADRRGFAISLGWHSELRKDYLYDMLNRMIGDFTMCQAMAAQGQELLDGKGTERLARILLDAVGEK